MQKCDVLVVGTSVTNTIIAAALSVAGKTVVHTDAREVYGEEGATLDGTALGAALRSGGSFSLDEELLSEGTRLRDVCADATLRPLLSAGDMVQLLVRAGTAKYLDFKCLQAAYIRTKSLGRAIRVPASKADVFQSADVTLLEKRLLMKFITAVQEGQVSEEWLEKPFHEFVSVEHRLQGLLMHVVLHAVCGLTKDEAMQLTTRHGVELVKTYAMSVGKYGKTAFLYPLYGGSETAQAFSRLCAVKGGTYMLRTPVTVVQVEANDGPIHLTGPDGLKIECSRIVTSPNGGESLLQQNKDNVGGRVCHNAVLWTKKQWFEGEDTLLHMTYVTDADEVAYAVQLDSTVKVCPNGTFLVYIWSDSAAAVTETLQAAGANDVDNRNGVWRWQSRSRKVVANLEPSHISVTSELHFGIDYADAIREAKSVFHEICGADKQWFENVEASNEKPESE